MIFLEHVHPDLAFQMTRIGALGIIVWNGVPPNDRVFEEHCHVSKAWVREHGPFGVFLNVAGSFVPSAAQRQIVAAYREDMGIAHIPRIAILTDSTLARSAMLVLTWLARSRSVETRGFRPGEIATALAWLEQVAPGAVDVEKALAAVKRAEKRFAASQSAAI